MPLGLDLVPVLLGAGAVLTAFRSMFIKLRARHKLSKAVRGAETITQVRQHLNKDSVTKDDVDAAATVIGNQLDNLDGLTDKEREAAKEALRQPSIAGRASYMRELAGSGQQADGNAAGA
jgi:hypothetical protein